MIKSQTFCDFCGGEFLSTYWDHTPCSVSLKFGGPAQSWESKEAAHVCKGCRTKLQEMWKALIKK